MVLNRVLDCANLTKEQIIKLSKHISEIINSKKKELDGLDKSRNKIIESLGSILDPRVVISNDEDNNEIILVKDNVTNSIRPDTLYNHVDLCERLDLTDTMKGSDIAGNRGYFLKHYGALLNNAIIRYAIDFLVEREYSLLYTPFFMKKEIMAKVAQLNEFDDTLYQLEGQSTYLIATSEQPITAFYQNTYLADKDLPIKLAGQSTCFRKEAGSHGKDTLGIFRVHQFEKIEQFCITSPEQSTEMMETMIDVCKQFYDSLNISYRIVSIVSGALNNAATIKYDLEAWFPGSKSYKELVSCSNCTDYQSRKLNVKYKDNKSGYVHMLNSTLCANTRVICCLLETYQTNEGFVVPDVLKKYMNGLDIIKYRGA